MNAKQRAENQRRSDRAAAALATYKAIYKVDPDCVLVDFVSDLRHYCKAHDIDFSTLLRISEIHYSIET